MVATDIKSLDDALASQNSISSVSSYSFLSLMTGIVTAALPAFFYYTVEQSWMLSPEPFSYALFAGLFLSAILLYFSYTKQTRKTYVRYAEEIRESGLRPSNLKKDEMPSAESCNSIVLSQSTAYAFTVINAIFFVLFFLMHFKVFMGVNIAPELRFLGSVGIPALLCFILS